MASFSLRWRGAGCFVDSRWCGAPSSLGRKICTIYLARVPCRRVFPQLAFTALHRRVLESKQTTLAWHKRKERERDCVGYWLKLINLLGHLKEILLPSSLATQCAATHSRAYWETSLPYLHYSLKVKIINSKIIVVSFFKCKNIYSYHAPRQLMQWVCIEGNLEGEKREIKIYWHLAWVLTRWGEIKETWGK